MNNKQSLKNKKQNSFIVYEVYNVALQCFFLFVNLLLNYKQNTVLFYIHRSFIFVLILDNNFKYFWIFFLFIRIRTFTHIETLQRSKLRDDFLSAKYKTLIISSVTAHHPHLSPTSKQHSRSADRPAANRASDTPAAASRDNSAVRRSAAGRIFQRKTLCTAREEAGSRKNTRIFPEK